MPNIVFKAYGGAKEIGRSFYTLEKENKKLVLDAGLKVMKEKEVLKPEIDENEEFNDIILSHAHTDHIGLLPLLKFKNAYATKPTKDLSKLIWADMRKISGLFSDKDIQNAYSKIKTVEYEKPYSIANFKAMFFEAGHIIGSAMTLLDDKILYTGDFNTASSRILKPAKPIKAETLIIEGTYARKNEVFLNKKELLKKFSNLINETLENGGSVVIPSLAIGRAQEVLLTLAALIKSRIIKNVPIYIDGMIKKSMKIYRQNAIYAKEEIKRQILASLEDPFLNPMFKVSRHKKRMDIKKPCIVVSTSGMLNGGPIFHYLKLFGNDERSLLLFVSYQPEHSNGYEVLNGRRNIKLNGEEIELKMKTDQLRFQGHANYRDIIRFIKTIKPKKVIMVHCHKDADKEIADQLKNIELIVPSIKEEVLI